MNFTDIDICYQQQKWKEPQNFCVKSAVKNVENYHLPTTYLAA